MKLVWNFELGKGPMGIWVRASCCELLLFLSTILLLGSFGEIAFHHFFGRHWLQVSTPNNSTSIPAEPKCSKILTPNQQKQELIKQITREAWNSTIHNATDPHRSNPGIAQSLTTLWIMRLAEEYREGRRAVAQFPRSAMDLAFLGSVLSLHSLTGDEMYANGSAVAAAAEAVWKSTGITKFEIYYQNLQHHFALRYAARLHHGSSSLVMDQAESKLTNSSSIPNLTQLRFLLESYRLTADPRLLISYIRLVDQYQNFWNNCNNKSSPYCVYNSSEFCRAGSLFASSSAILKSIIFLDNSYSTRKLAEKHLNLATRITEICRVAASESGLVPGRFRVSFETNHARFEPANPGGFAIEKIHYHSAELAEAYYFLHRASGNELYRHQAWALAQALATSYRIQNPTTGSWIYSHTVLYDPKRRQYHLSNRLRDQPVDFIGTTLKYLYLIFEEVDRFPVDRWIFNQNGQLFKI